MSSIWFFFVPTVAFISVVLPLWLVLHYWSKSRMSKGLSEQELDTLSQALAQAEKLEQRVRTLETILDAEHPQWRDHRDSDDAPNQPRH
ncbi:MAG: envelope stress response membrane protein PspB [Amphritea sp.]